ncbi:MAG: flagellin [Yoonia sp.]|jgi:flagellin
MSSILTNNSAMVALQTLKSINNDLSKTQSMISTGKEVASAKDNSAVWAISKVMESDVKGFKAISESLSLGESSVAVARNGSETVTDLLTDMKEKIVAAQGENVDRAKLQDDINALSDQISSVVGAAQFNGLNMLQGTDSVNVLSSLDRGSDGSVTSSNIVVNRQDLSSTAGTFAQDTDISTNVTRTLGAGSVNDAAGTAFSNAANTMTITLAATTATGPETYNIDIDGTTVTFSSLATGNTATSIADGLSAAITAAGIEGITSSAATGTITLSSSRAFDDLEVTTSTSDGAATTNINNAGASAGGASTTAVLEGRASTLSFGANTTVNAGDGYRVTIGTQNIAYVAGEGETTEDVVRGLKTAIDAAGIPNVTAAINENTDAGTWELKLDNDGTNLTLAVAGGTGGTASGGLLGLDRIDVTTAYGVESALANIETMINTSIDASAAFGSSQGRIETQSNFISSLTDSLRSGIGALVDADMEETSARLQALQVQQQLGVQSLSIANQAPQTILSLFR